MRGRFPLVLVASIVAAACSSKSDAGKAADTTAAAPATATAAPVDANAVRQAIDSANSKFAEAMKRGDTAAASANYADDAIVMMPNEEAMRGKAAMIKGLKDMFGQMSVKDMSFHTEDVMVGGDLAVETGSFGMTLQPKGGKAIEDKGKYLTVWKRQGDGSWKIVRDINNSNLPAAH